MLRDILIHPVLNGWQVQVGCQTVVFVDKQTMLTTISDYLEDPTKVEEYYRKNGVNAEWTLVQAVQAQVPDTAYTNETGRN